jgi:hypothetical protein
VLAECQRTTLAFDRKLWCEARPVTGPLEANDHLNESLVDRDCRLEPRPLRSCARLGHLTQSRVEPLNDLPFLCSVYALALIVPIFQSGVLDVESGRRRKEDDYVADLRHVDSGLVRHVLALRSPARHAGGARLLCQKRRASNFRCAEASRSKKVRKYASGQCCRSSAAPGVGAKHRTRLHRPSSGRPTNEL